ncbi:hypothetical protein ACH5RR_000374 [Cinchona calisaya]|uniref:Uncharacterized protein n=1 Tax=Cinchona calisaya TaxID=153742 RepID=A0ABD3B0L6_9GENT
MIQGEDEISPVILQSRILKRHDSSKPNSAGRSSLSEESGGIHDDDEIKEENTVVPFVSDFSYYKPRKSRKRFPRCNYRRSGSDTLPRYTRNEIAEQHSMIRRRPHYYKVFKYTIPSLIGLVAVKYQGKSEDPFKANPAPSWSSVAAVFMHSVIVLIIKHCQSHPTGFMQFLSRVEFASAVVLSLSLMSLLLPDSYGLVFPYISWTLFTIISAWPKFHFTYNWLLTRIKPVTNVITSFARNFFTGPNIARKPTLPPATGLPV